MKSHSEATGAAPSRSSSPPADASTAAFCIPLSRKWVFALVALFLAPWLIIGMQFWRNPAGIQSGLPASPAPAKASNQILPSTRGPWGELDVRRIITEPPAECMVPFLSLPHPTWYFEKYSREDLLRLLDAAVLAPEQRDSILRSASWPDDLGACVVTPGDDLLWSLSPEFREALYAVLSRDPRNTLQYDPFRIHAEAADQWFEGSGVPEEIRRKVLGLCYRRGKSLVFADPHLVLPLLPDDRTRLRLLKALARQSSLLVRVHIAPGQPVDGLLSYWRRAGASRDIQPFLESLSRLPDGYWLDLIHLLPPMARKYLFTYPLPENEDTRFDCHWTSMNFLNDPPDPRYGTMEAVQEALNSRYDQVLDEWRFGDVILFMLSETEVVHSAVYIADDIVFTKNGATERSPWTLMKTETVSSFYESAGPILVKAFRRRAAGTP